VTRELIQTPPYSFQLPVLMVVADKEFWAFYDQKLQNFRISSPTN
jgi:hypothetical protein